MTAGAVPAAASPPGDGLDRRVSALGMDTTAAPWVAARVDAYLGGMLRRLGLDGPGRSAPHPSPAHCAATPRRCAA